MMREPRHPEPCASGKPEDFAGRRLIDLLSGFSAASPHQA